MQLFHDKTRTCSVPPPDQSSRSSSLYYKDLVNKLPAVSSLVPCNDNAEKGLRDGIRAVIQIVLFYHMRCAECLDIKFKDMIKPSLFLVHGKKRSNDYTVHLPIGRCNEDLVRQGPGETLLFPFTYNSIWRGMVNAGMSIAVTSRVKRIVTHRARYELAAKLELLNERASITPLLRHKSEKSKEYYINVVGQ